MNSQPGWYPDPQNPTIVRFWDGQQWTSQTQPRSANLATVNPKPPMTSLTKVIWLLIAIAVGVVVLIVGTTVVANIAGQQPETITIDDAKNAQLTLRKDATFADPSTYEEISDRDFALVVKNPWANKDRRIILRGTIFQFDTVTGPDRFLAKVGTSTIGIGNNQTAQFIGMSTELDSFIEGDEIVLHVVVDGEYEYTSTSDKYTAVPRFQIGIIQRVG
ncbi:DUF2510 domain-containing protein [Rhodococcus erythropolis]|jgi:hypothetical protein|uniref:DUF2510 domain-containing protein n=1 Tax=Rhodococcus erythropolis group TaxID=2840174 RepID=UPI001BAB99FD|nr:MULTISPECIES: DUF2510 domain-containing protein [Rhodococcus erythropolis group]MBS2989062.1 DUF2510 domain-containing protein [Rhodococcus erythropolis]UXF65749.1 DUF2510 domain-containing protein [Rhodococcus qingshengii]